MRILLAEDHEIFRDGLKSVLARSPNIQIVGEAANGVDAVRLAKELAPDVVLMDIGMPQLNGIEATRQIRAASGTNGKQVRVIALSVHAEGVIVRRMLEAGAAGYLLKDAAAGDLLRAIENVMAGQVYLGQGLSDVVVKQFGLGSSTSPLSKREEDVLRHIAEGLTTKEIARVLGVSPKTVDTHRQHLMGKLDIHSIAELTKHALRLGLTSLEQGPKAQEGAEEPASE
jgi:DNA-binding NarL/FixJ family response regulator